MLTPLGIIFLLHNWNFNLISRFKLYTFSYLVFPHSNPRIEIRDILLK
jgi:hypothetical protein